MSIGSHLIRELTPLSKKKQLKLELDSIQSRLESIDTPNRISLIPRRTQQRFSRTHIPGINNSSLTNKAQVNPKIRFFKDELLKTEKINLPKSLTNNSRDSTHSLKSKDLENTIDQLKEKVRLLEEKLKEALESKSNLMIEENKETEEKSELTALKSKDIFSFAAIREYKISFVKNLEYDLKHEKEKSERYKIMYESEKEKYEKLKIDVGNAQGFIALLKGEKSEVKDDENVIEALKIRNKELFDQVLKLSDTIYEIKLENKELAFQRDQLKSKLIEIKMQTSELPEIRKHVLLLLNFIHNIKSGLKSTTNQDINYFNTKKYKDEISSLISQISNVTKSFNLSELIAKSDFGKGLFSQSPRGFSLSEYISKNDIAKGNDFGKGLLASTLKNRRLTEILTDIDTKLGAFSFMPS